MAPTIRVTMFKIPDPENVKKFLENYRTLGATAVKDGKPYILSLQAGPAHEDQRSQGYTLVSKTEFASLDDMKFYDHECAAHKELKVKGKELGVEGVLTVYYEPTVVSQI